MITIDGIVFSLQRQGGISVYFRQLLNHLTSSEIPAYLTTEAPYLQNIPAPSKYLSLIERKARVLERFRTARSLVETSVFHSSYYRLPKSENTPTVVTVHDFIYERFRHGPQRWAHIWQKHASIRAAQAVICVSESTREDLLEWVGEIDGQSIHVIHNGVSNNFYPIETKRVVNPFLLFVGERRGYKNFRVVLDALIYLPDMELHCVGGGSLQNIELEHVDDSVRKRVHHRGFVSDAELNILYNQAFCLVYPSSYEGFGIPVVEAMRAGCPVVCAPCKAVQEIGGTALTIAEKIESRTLADSVSMLELNEYRAQKIKQGLLQVEAYSWKNTHEKTLEVYRSLGADLTPCE